MTITPTLPSHVHVLKVSPGDVKLLDRVERVPGGAAITVPEFDAHTMILCTNDEALAKGIGVAVKQTRLKKTVKE